MEHKLIENQSIIIIMLFLYFMEVKFCYQMREYGYFNVKFIIILYCNFYLDKGLIILCSLESMICTIKITDGCELNVMI